MSHPHPPVIGRPSPLEGDLSHIETRRSSPAYMGPEEP
jgi:hypothetical protein